MKNRLIGGYARIAAAATCLGMIPPSSAQQHPSGQISGHVVDVVGATIRGASVYVRRNSPPDDEIRLLTHTDIRGDFKLELPEGGYDVLVTSPGFAANVETIPVSAKQTRQVRWQLKALNCNFPGMNCDTFQ